MRREKKLVKMLRELVKGQKKLEELARKRVREEVEKGELLEAIKAEKGVSWARGQRNGLETALRLVETESKGGQS